MSPGSGRAAQERGCLAFSAASIDRSRSTMPYVHRLRRLVRGSYASSCFYVKKKRPTGAGGLDMPRYHQLDVHSCGFLAALAVVRQLAPQTPAEEVLRVVGPSPACGCGQTRLIRCLKRLGVAAVYREGLGLRRLRRLAAAGTPVIVTVQPEWYECDHWTVVRGLDAADRVYLTNYDWLTRNGSMAWRDFLDIWDPRGAGLVCRPTHE